MGECAGKRKATGVLADKEVSARCARDTVIMKEPIGTFVDHALGRITETGGKVDVLGGCKIGMKKPRPKSRTLTTNLWAKYYITRSAEPYQGLDLL